MSEILRAPGEILRAPGAIHEPFGLTDMQQAYFVGQSPGLDLGGVSASMYGELDFDELDLDRLERAWSRVVERQHMLQAVVTVDGQQRILEQLPAWELPRTDLRRGDEETVAHELARIREALANRLVDVEAWPLVDLRATALPGRTRLHFSLPLVLMDGASAFIVLRDLARAYEDPDRPLPPLEISFRDCLHAMGSQGDDGASQAYWEERIPRLPVGPELPLAVNPASLRGHRFVHRDAAVPSEVWGKLKQQARQRGITTSALVLGIYADVVGAWSKGSRFSLVFLQTDRAVAHPQIYEIVGNFSSTLLVEIDRSRASFIERTKQLYRTYTEALEHRHYSGVQVIRRLLHAQSSHARALMPVTAVSNLSGRRSGGSGLPFGEVACRHLTVPQVLLDHQYTERADGGLALEWDMVDEAFPPGLPQQMLTAYLEHFTRLSGSFAAWMRPGGVPLPAEQSTRRARMNATASPLPEGLLHQPFERQAQAHPERPALLTPRRSLSYGELAAAARRLGATLEGCVAPGELVAVVMDKGWEQVVAVLGILDAGGAYLPIDPGLPAERRALLLSEARARVVLTQPVHAGADWAPGIEVHVVDDALLDGQAGQPAPALRPTPRQQPTDLAYVIFTSGSTGTPKGVMIEHRAALNTVVDINDRFGVTAQDRVFGISALSFDLSVWDIFGALAAGGAVVLPDPAHQRDPAHWSSLVTAHEVTIWNSVPTLAQMLVDQHEGPLPQQLRLVMMSGDWIPVALPDRLRQGRPELQVVSLGGATEASIWSILYPIEQVDPGWISIPYGHPMRNQGFEVLDDNLDPCPDWVPGQLHIFGDGLARGYWSDEQKTNSSFYQHPRSKVRLYRTGDLGRYLPGGEIEFLGREDTQVKVRGYRIELGEIAAALARCAGVQDAVVITRERVQGGREQRWTDSGEREPVGPSDKTIVGYYVPSTPEQPPEQEALHQQLAASLPEYMVPSTLVALEAIPLTPNGKVDRRALPAPEELEGRRAEAVPPASELEEQLLSIWREVLGAKTLGVTDDFFEHGGHSVLAAQVLARTRQSTGRVVPLAAMLEGRTVRRLARVLESRQPETMGCLVTMGDARPARALHLVHPVSGSVVCYAELARLLGERFPVVGLQALGLTGEPPHRSIEAMAAHYVELVRKRDPDGPYRLGGWSMGGMVSCEMARQLQDQGAEVEALVVIDASVGGPEAERHVDEIGFYCDWFANDLAGVTGTAPPAAQPVEGEAGLTARLDELLGWMRAAPAGSPFDDIEHLRQHFEVFVANARAMRPYSWRPLKGRVLLIRAADQGPLGDPRPTLGWERVAPQGLELVEVDGDHFQVVRRPSVVTVAEEIIKYMRS